MEEFRFPSTKPTGETIWGAPSEPRPGERNLTFTTVPRRFGAWIIDWFVPLLLMLGWSNEALADLMVLFVVWNSIWLQGRTGASIGKKVMGLKLAYIPEDMKRDNAWSTVVPGVGRCALRFVVHFFDAICFIGVFKGLANRHGRTLADVVAHTVVLWDDRPLISVEEYRYRRWGH